MHLPKLIQDLSLILAIAGASALIFRALKQPVVVGFLLAGILVGPQVTILPNVVDIENIKVWAELGVIFLLFQLGLEFSFRKLLEVGRTALIAASVEVVFMTAIGYATGWLLDWNSMDSLFLGGILAISSTTIIIKAFDEQQIRTQSFATIVLGILVIEDLFAILLLALLSTFGATRSLEGIELLKQVGFLTAFLTLTIPIGLWLIPRFFKLIRDYLTDEIRVIISLALCLALVVASVWAGFSPALGAFVMGALMGELNEGERAERFLRPIRDLFGAIFFTSVGMLMDTQVLLNHLPLILFISLVTIFGKVLTTALGSVLSGQNWKTSLQIGLSLGQIGEFSFIVATLGLTLGVIRPDLYPIAVAVSLITAFTTPYLIKYASSARIFTNENHSRRANADPKVWDGHLVEFEIHPDFKFVGHTLQEVKLREQFGVSIVVLNRGERKILAPNRNETLMPHDRIILLGTDNQLARVEKFLRTERHKLDLSSEVKYVLEKFLIQPNQPLIGLSLRESGIREKVNGIVLGIERNKQRILNPDSTTPLEEKDLLWIYGDRDRLRAWTRELEKSSEG